MRPPARRSRRPAARHAHGASATISARPAFQSSCSHLPTGKRRHNDEISHHPTLVAGVDAKQMSKKLIKAILLIEDNPGDARLLREMFNEQGLHDTELTLVDCMSAAE